MPRSFLFTREQIVQAALELTREGGIGAVTARALGARLGTSAKPVFGLFQSMTEVQQAVLQAADAYYHDYIREHMARGDYPAYKASGMAYIRFAKEEKELFKLLYMRDRSAEHPPKEAGLSGQLKSLVHNSTGFSGARAGLFHLEMWAYVHGVAAMLATGFLELDWPLISQMLTDAYMGLKKRFEEE